MHTVTLNPAAVTVTPGGAPQTIAVTVENVPADTTVAEAVTVAVGASTVSASFNVTVDNPSPSVTVTNNDPSVTVVASSPVQDATTATTWTFDLTISA